MIFIRIFAVLSLCFLCSYIKPKALSESEWQEAEEFLLPEQHPIKAKLDKIFKKAHVTQNAKSLRSAGFRNAKPSQWSNTIITTHDKLKGYIFKLFTDDQQNVLSYEKLKKRIVGAEAVRAAIKNHGFQEMFHVPHKWLYPIKDGQHPFILVAEDCHLLTHEGTIARWKNMNDPQLLVALFALLSEKGLSDSTVLVNIPFNLENKVCFIDLEIHHHWPVNYEQLTPFLSSKMQKHWTSFFQKN